ncbi:unnamed protein product [Menidia menidia]|uniref:Protein phosphatase methylesterase 1 n=1 Tax=Menidia menidia TaxID=238744 RepID=A0A8S4AJW5_9TELE|nr:unnamed protein product [Menidia menidia]
MEKQLHLNLLASRPPVAGGFQSGSKMKMGPGRKRDFTPLPWSQYFETMEDVEVENENGKDISLTAVFIIYWEVSIRLLYCSGSHGPVLLLLHGGGHSALSWAVFTAVISSRINCRVVAMDLRAHGDTKVRNPEDLSADTMAKDVGKVVEVLYGENPPPIMIIGHSMGGAIAVHTANANHVPSLLGLCVIDVVEGTAMDALNSMQNFLRSRPKTFKSLENAIEWSMKSGQIRNLESARVSMGGQVKKCDQTTSSPSVSISVGEGIIEEEEEEEAEEQSNKKRMKEDDQEVPFSDSPHLSLCLLPSICRNLKKRVDRLDKDLTIGQMQGKFQMQVLPQCGHAVHEDAPEKVADALATFMVRHKFTEFKEGFLW